MHIGVELMKTDKSKLHQHRKVRKAAHLAESALPEAAAISETELMLMRMERSPKQENL